jgi:hypothetical protein
VADTRQAMKEFFLDRVRAHLHVVLCMSPTGENLRVRCRKFPALISCSSSDWFHEWPKEALVKVATHFLKQSKSLQKRQEYSAAALALQEGDEDDDLESRASHAEKKKKAKDALKRAENENINSIAENIAHHMATVHQVILYIYIQI